MLEVYVVGITGRTAPAKIGYAKRPLDRLAELQAGNHLALELYWHHDAATPARVIACAAEILADARLRGDWFDTAPAFAAEVLQQAIFAVCRGGEPPAVGEIVAYLEARDRPRAKPRPSATLVGAVERAVAVLGRLTHDTSNPAAYFAARRSFAHHLAHVEKLPVDQISAFLHAPAPLVNRWIGR